MVATVEHHSTTGMLIDVVVVTAHLFATLPLKPCGCWSNNLSKTGVPFYYTTTPGVVTIVGVAYKLLSALCFGGWETAVCTATGTGG